MNDKISVSSFTGGFLLGIVLGLFMGFIFAPQAGAKSRGILKERLTEIPETIKEITADREKVYRETKKRRKGQPLVGESYFEV